jgi:hypothetical protein
MPTSIPENSTTQVSAVPANPARGVVLELATKMRQSRGREGGLNAYVIGGPDRDRTDDLFHAME